MLLEILRLTPSAVNIQPWHFYVGSSDAAKNLIRPCVLDFNHARLDGCSHFIVLCAKTSVSDEEFSAITKKEDADGRYSKAEVKNSVDEHRRYFADMHVKMGDFNEWTAKQTYLAMAALLYGAASLGIDSTPIEGMDYEKCDEILKLKEKSLRSVGIVTLGYRAKDDSNAAFLPAAAPSISLSISAPETAIGRRPTAVRTEKRPPTSSGTTNDS